MLILKIAGKNTTNIPVLSDLMWLIGVVVVASNLLHVQNSQDPVKFNAINETTTSSQ